MELSEEVKKIAEFWLNFEFLKKFKKLGENYLEQVEREKKSVGAVNGQAKV